jgi:hypothetical protein
LSYLDVLADEANRAVDSHAMSFLFEQSASGHGGGERLVCASRVREKGCEVEHRLAVGGHEVGQAGHPHGFFGASNDAENVARRRARQGLGAEPSDDCHDVVCGERLRELCSLVRLVRTAEQGEGARVREPELQAQAVKVELELEGLGSLTSYFVDLDKVALAVPPSRSRPCSAGFEKRRESASDRSHASQGFVGFEREPNRANTTSMGKACVAKRPVVAQ